MRTVQRSLAAPLSLGGSLAIDRRHSFLQYLRLDPAKREQTRVPIMEFDSREVLRDLSHLFLGKCAFCEQASKPMYVHRFRPTNDADPIIGDEHDGRSRDAHLYYGWFSDAWINLYPICGECRPKRANYFPVSGQRMPVPTADEYEQFVARGDGTWPELTINESPLLLDPCGPDEVVRHLVPLEDGSLQAASPMGDETIRQFNLNRTRLKKKRQQAFAEYAGLRGSGPNDTNEFIGLWLIFSRQTPVSVAEQAEISASSNIVEEDDTATRPRLTEITLTNFKAIETLSIKMPAAPEPSERLAQALLILGENAAGKSSILEAVALALAHPDARSELAPKPDSLRLDPSFMGAPEVKKKAIARVRLRYDGNRESTLTIRGNGFRMACCFQRLLSNRLHSSPIRIRIWRLSPLFERSAPVEPFPPCHKSVSFRQLAHQPGGMVAGPISHRVPVGRAGAWRDLRSGRGGGRDFSRSGRQALFCRNAD